MLYCCLGGLTGAAAAPAAAKAAAADLGQLVGQWVDWCLAPSSILFATAQQLLLVLGEPTLVLVPVHVRETLI